MGSYKSTPRARALGAQLRQARKEAGLTMRELAEKLKLQSHAPIGHWESGARPPKVEDVATYLAAVGVSGSRREEILALARRPDGPQWVSVGMPAQREQLAALCEFERTATHITEVTPLLVPGLLQTADYARAIMARSGKSPAEVETRVAIRLGRRSVLERDSLRFIAMVGEAALRTVVGGVHAMTEQLRFLLKAATWPSVGIRVIPLEADWYPAMEGAFTIFRFSDSDPIVCLENRISGMFLHRPEDVDAYEAAQAMMDGIAMGVTESLKFISDRVSRLEMM
ncbi:transcriptional regulator [Longimycelium tulufanense]|uniref:Transcriptional regulator n=1 Tax=Longimycelium tulufanense TaxID=907463 RepID=A0A8J3CDC5_9PSEU|nr:helix-turn-helix transcriptional regulator [Longimycelium tulufanense]GGM43442.1 transcriptional regulator [Longimycelium tulufanense]